MEKEERNIYMEREGEMCRTCKLKFGHKNRLFVIYLYRNLTAKVCM